METSILYFKLKNRIEIIGIEKNNVNNRIKKKLDVNDSPTIWPLHTGRYNMHSHTDISLSLTTTRVQIPAMVCEKVASDLGLVVVFDGYSSLLNH